MDQFHNNLKEVMSILKSATLTFFVFVVAVLFVAVVVGAAFSFKCELHSAFVAFAVCVEATKFPTRHGATCSTKNLASLNSVCVCVRVCDGLCVCLFFRL